MLQRYGLWMAAAWLATAQTPPDSYHALPQRNGWHRGSPITFRVLEGQALVEGDMLLGRALELQTPPDPRNALFRAGARYRWPDGVIPYEIDDAIPNPERIHEAIAEWNGRTVIRLQPHNGEADFVFFRRASSGCASHVGRIGGRQLVNLADDCSRGVILHEIGHSVGLFHTQSREDRALHIRTLYQNAAPLQWSQFDQTLQDSEDVGPYDYGSVMHYGATSFPAGARDTIQTLPAGIPIGQRLRLSEAEIRAIARVYGKPLSGVLIDTFPSGLPIEVDGVRRTSPYVAEWAPGERHTLSVVPRIEETPGETQLRFARWSDGGREPERVVEHRRGTDVYIANYARYIRLRTGVSPEGAGEVEAWPYSDDGFYPSGTQISLRATPHGPYRFFRWVSGPGGVTYLGANQQGNGANPVELNLRGARAHYVAAFTTRDFTVITASRPGVGILVDGRPTFTPRHEDWPDDSAHTYAAEDSVDEVNGVRTRFQRWTRSGGAAQTITAELEFDYRTSSDLILSWPNSLTGIVRDAIRLYPLPADGWLPANTELQAFSRWGNAPFLHWFAGMTGDRNPGLIRVDAPLQFFSHHVNGPYLSPNGVVNEASGQPSPVTPGGRLKVYSPGIGENAGPLRALLGERNVRVEDVTENAVTILVPQDLPPFGMVRLSTESGADRRSVLLPAQPAFPGLYAIAGVRQIVAFNEDGTQNSPETPAPRRTLLRFQAAGLSAFLPLAVTIDGLPADIVTVEPGDAEGRVSLIVRIPEHAPAGPAIPIAVSSAGAVTQSNATIALR